MPLLKELLEKLSMVGTDPVTVISAQGIVSSNSISNLSVTEAHTLLLEAGYQFVGYHGTNEAGAKNIIPNGFNPKHIGTGGGTERGFGFYVSFKPNLAQDFKASDGKLLRIYVENFQTLRLGIDYKWGLMCTPGDPNRELDIERRCDEGAKRLELILSPAIYHKLIAIVSGGEVIDRTLDRSREDWPFYTIDEQTLDLLGNIQPIWFPPAPLKRVHSGVKEWSSLQKWTEFGLAHLTEGECYEKGLKYYHGMGTPVDMEKAREWFSTIEYSHPGAQSYLGDIYENGRGVSVDFIKAVKYYQLAQNAGHASATFSLARCYEEGKGVGKDINRARELFEISVNKGYEASPGYFNMFKQRNGLQPLVKDEHLSKEELYQRGSTYYYGKVVPEDMAQAKYYFELAAAKQHPGAICRLGDIHEHGRGVPRNIEKAIKYYQEAAALEDNQAIFALGKCYETGNGVPLDLIEALGYYERAYNNRYEAYPKFFHNFVKDHPELTPYLNNRMSHRRFLLDSR